jgi:hypothetical protein
MASSRLGPPSPNNEVVRSLKNLPSELEELQKVWLDHIQDNAFPREFGRPWRTLCLSHFDYTYNIRRAGFRDCFVSVYAFDADFARRYGEDPKPYELARVDSIYFDCDCEFNLMLALADARKLVKILVREFGCTPRVYFTGCKGFAVYADFPAVQLKRPKETLEKFCDDLAEQNDLKTLDRRTFGDIARISRIPGTINTKARQRWGENLWCRPLANEELFEAKNELDIIKLARYPPIDCEIEAVPSQKLADRLQEIDEQIVEDVAKKRLLSELMWLEGTRPRRDSLAEKLIEMAEAITDGRKRILHFLIVPRLIHRKLSDAEIEARCREFIERSGRKWENYRSYVKQCLRRTRQGNWLPWRLETFIEENPDLKEVLEGVGG